MTTTKDLAAKAEASWNKYATVCANSFVISCHIEKGRLAYYINGEKVSRKIAEGTLK